LPWTTQLDHQVFLHSNSSLTNSNSATWSLKTRAWHVLLLIFFFFQMTMTISDRERFFFHGFTGSFAVPQWAHWLLNPLVCFSANPNYHPQSFHIHSR
jgi:hypothetical protein